MSNTAKQLHFYMREIEVLSRPGMREYYGPYIDSANRMAAMFAGFLIAGAY